MESGDLLWLDGHWYVSHSGLIRLARRSHCAGIHVEPPIVRTDRNPATVSPRAHVPRSARVRLRRFRVKEL